jgi:predicted nucleic acid-binding protein
VKVFLDTSVLVAAVVYKHESHARAFPILERVLNGKDEGFISGHSVAEMYAVLTRLPHPYKHTPEQAFLSIDENVVKHFKVTVLSGADYAALVKEAALAKILGGTIYDAVLIRCALKSKAERIYTLNVRHFQNIAPKQNTSQIVGP